MILSKLPAALLAGLALAGSAHAEFIDLGVMTHGMDFHHTGSGANVDDTFRLVVGAVKPDFEFNISNRGLQSFSDMRILLNGNQIVQNTGRTINASWGPFGTVPFAAGTEFLVHITGTDNTLGNPAYVFSVTTAPVPEPASMALMLSGLAGVGLLRGMRGRRAARPA